jgi:CelD/BcsL family acetyltransferase involved in cellulose biosynthesis
MIVSVVRASDADWDSMVEASPTAIYFQTREWFEIWSEYAGYQNETRLIRFASGKKVLLPLCRRDFLGRLLRLHFLAPKGMGGFVTDDTLDPQEKKELGTMLRGTGMLYGRLNAYDTLTNELVQRHSNDSTQVLDLRGGFEQVIGRWTEGHRKRARKGLREDVTFERSTKEEDWKAYYALYRESLARWGDAATNSYGWGLFQAMCRSRSGRIQLWLAKQEGRAVCGAINLYHQQHVAAWHSAGSEELRKKLNATLALEYSMIKDACEKGFLHYDFGPSGDLEGPALFKRGFGTESRMVRVYKAPLLEIFTALRMRLRKHPATRFLMRGIGS